MKSFCRLLIFDCISIILLIGCTDTNIQNTNTDNIPVYIKRLENLKSISLVEKEVPYTIEFKKQKTFGSIDSIFIEFASLMAVDNNGRVFLGESLPNSRTIYVFDKDDGFITKIGNRGRGPGEFLSISNMKIFNQKLYVLDKKLYRISVFLLEDFNLSHTISLSMEEIRKIKNLENSIPEDAFYIFNENLFLTDFSSPRPVNQDDGTRTDDYYFMDNRGELVSNKILSLKKPYFFTSNEKPGPGFILPFTAPFSRSSLIDVTNDGTIFTSWTEDFLIKVYDEKGIYQRAYYYPYKKSDLSKDRVISSFGKGRQEILNEKELPNTWPALHQMVLDDKNRLWVFTITDSDTTYKAWVLNKEGEPLATFDWPGNRLTRRLYNANNMFIKDGYLYERNIGDDREVKSVTKFKIIFKKK